MSELVPELEGPDNNNSGTDLETLDYLRGVKSSTCLLLPTTPSPTALDFQHPLADQMTDAAFLTLNDETSDLKNIDTSAGDSSSSADSNSVVQDPVSAQLINNISMLEYQTLSKNGDHILNQVEDCKLNGNLNVGNRKLPGFINWNWAVIRKVLLWIVLSGLIACLGAIIAMIVTIPTSCNPDLPWYQGKVIYEIFPASFKDSNNDGIGDLKGIIKKLDYIEELGASAIRLNYIFEASNYPDHYYNTTSLIRIDRSIGTDKDFKNLVGAAHSRNMFVVIDIPVISIATPVFSRNLNVSHTILTSNGTVLDYFDPTSDAIAYWSKVQNVDGFYLKNLEKFVDDVNFGSTLQIWKQMIGAGKIFIASEAALQKAKGDSLHILLSRVDLIDVPLHLNNDITHVKNRIDEVLSGPLWSKPHYPWVLWNIGDIDSERIASKQMNNTLVLRVLQFSLPGTINMFYGDEIGLGGISAKDVERDFHEHKHVHNVPPMMFPGIDDKENSGKVLSWNSKSSLDPNYHYLEIIKSLTKVRLNTPTIYLNGIFKEGNIFKNAEVRQTENDLVVVERWFPRRNTCVFVGNLGNSSITTDLSTMFYGGTVIAGTNTSLIRQVLYFEKITFLPNSGVILKLEK
ncbi:hypothetical protein JYU34_008473 [Plutella xylostella]|uniref:Glycosyl hydrolase family 13 catalytic domain-containing protein n=1 Tax=Plutella xylostella TaxID=51655 RepID=A0ABQ7QL10_PLUXY|nr:hypothetical protein JYU34_008473 [Plutella xylostella]